MVRLALKAASFHVRDHLRTRLPFRDGIVTLAHFPLLHLAVKSFLNRSLVHRPNRERRSDRYYFMSAEDLTNVPVQQDLATMRALGVTHVERNGHHCVRGMAHCSRRERRDAARLHADLYRGDEREASLRIGAGHTAVGSLDAPGYGAAFEPGLDAMTPLDRWGSRAMEAAT